MTRFSRNKEYTTLMQKLTDDYMQIVTDELDDISNQMDAAMALMTIAKQDGDLEKFKRYSDKFVELSRKHMQVCDEATNPGIILKYCVARLYGK